LLGKRVRAAAALSTLACVGAAILLFAEALPAMAGAAGLHQVFELALPGGSFALGLDALSGFFLALIAVLAIPTSIFGSSYLLASGRANVSRAFASFNLLVASMALLVSARNGLLFLMAWEAMTLASYFLVAFEHEHEESRSAGLRYLIASHLGAACLIALFAILGTSSGGLEFGAMADVAAHAGPWKRAIVFALAVLGFGTKMGLVPLHVWLPLAHPAAPSHVSALMSGVMIKMGAYGLVRTLDFLGPTPWPYGLALLAIGAVTAVFGIACAIGQRDLKRALAYSSIENMGIVALALGLARMAASLGHPAIARIAALGALLHLTNHMAMKGLLFLSAGSVLHAAHTRDLERMGGLLPKLRWTGASFLVGAVSIAALPPLCGFGGEWLILSAAFGAAGAFAAPAAVTVGLAMLALVTAAGLAAASFARLFASAFLGRPRSPLARDAHESGALLVAPMLALAAACFALGVAPRPVLNLLERAAQTCAGSVFGRETPGAIETLSRIGPASALVLGSLALLFALWRFAGSRKTSRDADTWGCGYALPSARLQYTASSFAQPLVRIFGAVVAPSEASRAATGPFPREVEHATHVPDRVSEAFYAPLHRALERRSAALRRFQDGNLNKYVLLIVAVQIACLLWVLASRWFSIG
jgi:hydrogenase-4 component B